MFFWITRFYDLLGHKPIFFWVCLTFQVSWRVIAKTSFFSRHLPVSSILIFGLLESFSFCLQVYLCENWTNRTRNERDSRIQRQKNPSRIWQRGAFCISPLTAPEGSSRTQLKIGLQWIIKMWMTSRNQKIPGRAKGINRILIFQTKFALQKGRGSNRTKLFSNLFLKNERFIPFITPSIFLMTPNRNIRNTKVYTWASCCRKPNNKSSHRYCRDFCVLLSKTFSHRFKRNFRKKKKKREIKRNKPIFDVHLFQSSAVR
jgi:hypothetical protein